VCGTVEAQVHDARAMIDSVNRTIAKNVITIEDRWSSLPDK